MSIFVRSMGGLFFVAGMASVILGIGLMDGNEIRMLALISSIGELKGVIFVVGGLTAFFFGTVLLLGATICDHLKRLADINASAAVQISSANSMYADSAYLSTYIPQLPETQGRAPDSV